MSAERYSRGSFAFQTVAAIAELTIPRIVIAGGFVVLANCRQTEMEQLNFKDWNRQNQVVEIGTTLFEAKAPFSRGSYFGDGDPTYFPFDVKIHTGNVARYRRAVSDVLPETATLWVTAAQPEFKYQTYQSMSPGTKSTTIGASFDHRIGKQVFWEVRDRTLTNKKVREEFAQRIERELLMWMVYAVYVAAGVLERRKIQPPEKIGEVLQEAQQEALGIAYTKVLTLLSPFKISADKNYNYRSHYQQLD